LHFIDQREAYSVTLNPIIFALKDWEINHKRKLFEEGFTIDNVGEIPKCLLTE
jgi:hypothetical protein